MKDSSGLGDASIAVTICALLPTDAPNAEKSSKELFNFKLHLYPSVGKFDDSKDARMLAPVASLYSKWRRYSERYSLPHAACAFVGTRSAAFWRLSGPLVTRHYLSQWLNDGSSPRVLNLGGGSNIRPEWLTADIDARADVHMDLSEPLPLPDSSLDAIFLEEVIEHFNYEMGRSLLLECCRVLKPSSMIRVSTPDLDWFIRQKLEKTPVFPGILTEETDRVFGAAGANACSMNVAVINSIFFSHGHRFIYDREALGEQLRSAGFTDIRFGTYREDTLLGRFDSHADRFNHPPEMSLYVEARAIPRGVEVWVRQNKRPIVHAESAKRDYEDSSP